MTDKNGDDLFKALAASMETIEVENSRRAGREDALSMALAASMKTLDLDNQIRVATESLQNTPSAPPMYDLRNSDIDVIAASKRTFEMEEEERNRRDLEDLQLVQAIEESQQENGR